LASRLPSRMSQTRCRSKFRPRCLKKADLKGLGPRKLKPSPFVLGGRRRAPALIAQIVLSSRSQSWGGKKALRFRTAKKHLHRSFGLFFVQFLAFAQKISHLLGRSVSHLGKINVFRDVARSSHTEALLAQLLICHKSRVFAHAHFRRGLDRKRAKFEGRNMLEDSS